MAEIIEQGTCGHKLTWTLDNEGLLTISGEGKMENYGFFDSPFKNTNVTKVEISQGVTSIGESAFSGCKALTSIEIPSSVTSIGNYAFKGCKALTSIEIPNSVTSIGWSAFEGCEALTSIHIRCEHPEDLKIGKYAFDETNIENCTLYVPIGTGYAYRHHPVFSKFKEVIIEK